MKESDPRTSCEMEENQEFLETACLYVVAQSETFPSSLSHQLQYILPLLYILPLSPSPSTAYVVYYLCSLSSYVVHYLQ